MDCRPKRRSAWRSAEGDQGAVVEEEEAGEEHHRPSFLFLSENGPLPLLIVFVLEFCPFSLSLCLSNSEGARELKKNTENTTGGSNDERKSLLCARERE